MTRTVRVARTSYPHRSATLAIAALTAAALTACGDSGKKKAPAVDTAASAPPAVVVPESTVAATDSGALPDVPFTDAEAAYRGRDYAQAAELFAGYTQHHPTNPFGFYMLGLSAWKTGDLDRAQGAFEQALQRDPKHVKSLVNLSRVLVDEGRPADALERMTVAVGLDSTSPEVYRVMGRVRAALGQPDSAIVAYQTALGLDSGDVWSMNNMGLLLIQRGRYDEALGPLSLATQLDSGVAVFQNNLGIALERTGHYAAAGQAYRAALEADSTYAKAGLSLARVDSLTEDPALVPVDLAALAQTFAKQVDGWREARLLASVPAPKAPEPVPPQQPQR